MDFVRCTSLLAFLFILASKITFLPTLSTLFEKTQIKRYCKDAHVILLYNLTKFRRENGGYPNHATKTVKIKGIRIPIKNVTLKMFQSLNHSFQSNKHR